MMQRVTWKSLILILSGMGLTLSLSSDWTFLSKAQEFSSEISHECLEEETISNLSISGNIYFWGGRTNPGMQQLSRNLVPESAKEVVYHTPNASLGMAILAPSPDPLGAPSRQLLIFDASNTIVRRVSWREEWQSPYSLTFDGQVIVNKPNATNVDENGFTSIITKGGELAFTNFDHFPYILPIVSQGTFLSFVVSPNGSQVVYDAFFPGINGEYVRGIALAQVADHKVLWVSDAIQDAVAIQWSPDGRQFAYTHFIRDTENRIDSYKTEIASVNKDGNEKILTNFTERNTRHIQSLAGWSSNSSKIAFWLLDVQPNDPTNTIFQSAIESTLYFLDVQQNIIVDLCLRTHKGTFPRIVWSPDSARFIYVEQEPGILSGNLIMVDIHKRKYVRINVEASEILKWE